MSSLPSISVAIESVDAKKENLRKLFEDLQSHSSFLSSFSLQWKDLEDHFDSIQKSIEERFKELESKEKQFLCESQTLKKQSLNGSQTLEKQSLNGSQTLEKQSSSAKEPEKKLIGVELVSHPEMKSICTRMDGMGLRSYIMKHRKELQSIRNEVAIALQFASDPAKLVLDALQGFYPTNSKGDKDGELAAIRRTCILLLEQLIDFSPQITPQVKEKASKLAVEWKGKVTMGDENPLEPLAFLQLLVTYGLASVFEADELLDLAVYIARRKQAIDLCRALGFTDKIPDLIEKLSNKGKQLEAVKFAYAFDLVDKFPPVPLLKAYLKQSKKVAVEIRNKGNHSVQSQNEATAKELASVRAIIKCIEEHDLESQYPRGSLDKRVEQLEKQKADRKRPASGTGSGPKQQQQQLSGNKRPRPSAPKPIATATPVVPISYSRLQPEGIFPDGVMSYMSSSDQYELVGSTSAVGSYGSTPAASQYGTSTIGSYGSTPAASQYGTSAVGSYGLGTNRLSYGVSPSRSHLYSSESLMTSGLYDRSMGYGAHVLPTSHRPSFYP